ncbi:MAG: hypothetical protein HC939_15185 [Pleurocapsa sp. SU_5_0]|nr:hypothetical protein [Pleurocapsa sp. SU_5_0]
MAQQLVKDRQKFVILDRESDRVAKAEQLGYLATIGNATDENLLISVGIQKARVLATRQEGKTIIFIYMTSRLM